MVELELEELREVRVAAQKEANLDVQVKQVFEEFDINNDGALSKLEFAEAVQRYHELQFEKEVETADDLSTSGLSHTAPSLSRPSHSVTYIHYHLYLFL